MISGLVAKGDADYERLNKRLDDGLESLQAAVVASSHASDLVPTTSHFPERAVSSTTEPAGDIPTMTEA
jgi:hypothetical protein